MEISLSCLVTSYRSKENKSFQVISWFILHVFPRINLYNCSNHACCLYRGSILIIIAASHMRFLLFISHYKNYMYRYKWILVKACRINDFTSIFFLFFMLSHKNSLRDMVSADHIAYLCTQSMAMGVPSPGPMYSRGFSPPPGPIILAKPWKWPLPWMEKIRYTVLPSWGEKHTIALL